MAYVTAYDKDAQEMIDALCMALGLDPKEVCNIDLHVPADGIITADVKLIVTDRIHRVDWSALARAKVEVD